MCRIYVEWLVSTLYVILQLVSSFEVFLVLFFVTPAKYSMARLYRIQPFSYWWTLRLCLISTITNNAAINILMHICLLVPCVRIPLGKSREANFSPMWPYQCTLLHCMKTYFSIILPVFDIGKLWSFCQSASLLWF